MKAKLKTTLVFIIIKMKIISFSKAFFQVWIDILIRSELFDYFLYLSLIQVFLMFL